MPILSFEDINAGYGKKEVLRGLSLRVASGEIVALFGDNGSGKSTALRVAAGVLRPWSGRIVLDGRDISGLLPHEVRRLGISYLPQNARVFKSLSVQENLAVAGHARDRNRDGFVFPATREIRTRRAGLLSGGERQMLAVELALRRDATILLLDEPTANLSRPLVARMLERIAQLAKKEGTGVILVEQNVEEARRVADSEVYLRMGRNRQEKAENTASTQQGE